MDFISHKKCTRDTRGVGNLLRLLWLILSGHGSAARCAAAAADRDEQMVANGKDLRRHVTAEDIGKRTDGYTFVVRREKCRHSRTREDLLRIPYPLQDPIGPQAFVSKLEIRREILRRFPGRNRIACGMAAHTLQFHKEVGADTQ